MTIWLMLAMLAVIATWALLALILAGVGLGLQSAFGLKQVSASSVLIAPWNGLAIILLFLQAWHFLLPIRWPATIVCAIAGAAGLVAARAELARWRRSVRIGPPLAAALVLIALWIANRAIGPGNALDSGVYHFQVIRWNHEHAIVPGLANLHPLYAMNNSCHLFDALLQVGPWEGRANHLANGLLVLIWLQTVAISAARLLRGGANRAQNLFNLILLIPLVMYAVSKEASSPTSDLPQAALLFAAASTLVRMLAAGTSVDSHEASFATVSIVLLSAAALCVKLSAGALAVPMAMLALGAYLTRRPPAPRRGATIMWSCGLALALALTWIGRGVILSGCPLYPSRFLSVPVEWRVPEYVAGGLRSGFRSDSQSVRVGMLQRAVSSEQFRRLPGWMTRPIRAATEDPNSTGAWMAALAFASTIEVPLPALLAAGAAVVLVGKRIAGRSSKASLARREWLICVPPLIALGFWAARAPEPRYGAAPFWILAAALVSMACRTTLRPGRAIIAVAALAMLPIGYRMLTQAFNPAAEPVQMVLFIPAGPDHGLHPIPVVPTEPMRTESGLVIFVPVGPTPCWDAALPATTAPHPMLRLRLPDDLDSGFALDDSAGN